MLDFGSLVPTTEVQNMQFGRKCPRIGRGTFLLFCNLIFLSGLGPFAVAWQTPGAPQNPSSQSSSEPSNKHPQTPQVGTFEEGTESQPSANSQQAPSTAP